MDLTNDDGLSPGISNKRYTFDEANEQFLNNQNWSLVLSMLTHDNFNGDLRWISDSLNLNLEDVFDAIEGLSALRVISYINGKITVLKECYESNPTMFSKEELLNSVIFRNISINQKVNTKNVRLGICRDLLATPELVKEFNERVHQLIYDLEQRADLDGKKTNLYSVSAMVLDHMSIKGV